MNKGEATVIAERYVALIGNELKIDICINPDLTEEFDEGFVFFYNTYEFWRTRNSMSSLVGNGPILVNRGSGELEILKSNQSVQKSMTSRGG